MSDRTPLKDTQIDALLKEYPGLPKDYLEYLKSEGYGEAESGSMIYSGPIFPDEIYGDGYEGPNVLVLADDTQGYCLAYDLSAQQYGEISDSGEWKPWEDDDTFSEYVSDEE